ncbi:hypothetical protein TrST_g5090 [Triparma strigata]|uniref:Uncharacterized protein n=1 Tax=Triparma strigata TaxID=1606541 RepID=A0A9W7EEX0_9STRA|nr:hypothetical protein TrST_g5090 [Triparma strigata]
MQAHDPQHNPSLQSLHINNNTNNNNSTTHNTHRRSPPSSHISNHHHNRSNSYNNKEKTPATNTNNGNTNTNTNNNNTNSSANNNSAELDFSPAPAPAPQPKPTLPPALRFDKMVNLSYRDCRMGWVNPWADSDRSISPPNPNDNCKLLASLLKLPSPPTNDPNERQSPQQAQDLILHTLSPNPPESQNPPLLTALPPDLHAHIFFSGYLTLSEMFTLRTVSSPLKSLTKTTLHLDLRFHPSPPNTLLTFNSQCLQTLDLSYYQSLTEELLESLPSSLKTLNLKATNLSQSHLPSLSHLLSLSTLDISKTTRSSSTLITSLTPLSHLSSLTSLNISYNTRITSVPFSPPNLDISLTSLTTLPNLHTCQTLSLPSTIPSSEILKCLNYNSLRSGSTPALPGTGAVTQGEKNKWKNLNLFHSPVTSFVLDQILSRGINVILDSNINIDMDEYIGREGVTIKDGGRVVPRRWRGRVEGVNGVVIEQS